MKLSCAMVLLLLASMPLAAQSLDWSSVGSTGIVDSGDIGSNLWNMTGATFTLKPSVVGAVEARYPVTNTVGSATDLTPGWTTFSAAMADDTSLGSVTATLYEVDKCSNTQTQLCTLTSSDSDSSPHCYTCEFQGGLDFANNAYYIDVSIARDAATGTIALYELALY